MGNITGKTIVITGAARGIGHATAKALLQRGARVVIGDRDVHALESAVTALDRHGPVSGYPLDVTNRQSFAEFLDKARSEAGGRIDVLINNAGVMPIGPFLQQSEQALRSSIEVNFYGVLNGCQLVLPEMVARRGGHIVNIASLAGMIAVPGQAVYAGTKFAVVGLSVALADEFASQGVEVSAILPTFTNTELITGTHPSAAQKPVQPEQIAAAVVKVLDKPTTVVSVPRYGRFMAATAQMLGPRGRRWLNKKLGNDRVFLDFDPTARQHYEDRAQHALGVTDDSPNPSRTSPRESHVSRFPLALSLRNVTLAASRTVEPGTRPVCLDLLDVVEEAVGRELSGQIVVSEPTKSTLTQYGKSLGSVTSSLFTVIHTRVTCSSASSSNSLAEGSKNQLAKAVLENSESNVQPRCRIRRSSCWAWLTTSTTSAG